MFDADALVLLHAVTKAIRQHNFHQFARQMLVHDLEGSVMALDEQMHAARAEAA